MYIFCDQRQGESDILSGHEYHRLSIIDEDNNCLYASIEAPKDGWNYITIVDAVDHLPIDRYAVMAAFLGTQIIGHTEC